MSSKNMTRLEVQRLIRNAIIEGLRVYNLPDWDVMEFAQANFQKADKVILFNCVRMQRVGWQSESYETIDDLLKKTSWIEEQTWQIHTICKRDMTEGADSFLAEDMANMLITWFNGDGCDYFRNNGCANLRIDHDNIFVYNDNSDLYQKRAVFSLKIQVPKEVTIGLPDAEILEPRVKPV